MNEENKGMRDITGVKYGKSKGEQSMGKTDHD